MKRVFDHLRDRLYARAGLMDPPNPKLCIDEIRTTQWSCVFEKYMRNRLVMGFFRYGALVSDERVQKPYNNVASAIERLQKYLVSGNQEHLVDAANLCMVEFMVPSCHSSPRWDPKDDDMHTDLK